MGSVGVSGIKVPDQYNNKNECVECGAQLADACANDCVLAAWVEALRSLDTTVAALSTEDLVAMSPGFDGGRWEMVAHYFAQGWIQPHRFYAFTNFPDGQLAPLDDRGVEAGGALGGAHEAVTRLLEAAARAARNGAPYADLVIVCQYGAWQVKDS